MLLLKLRNVLDKLLFGVENLGERLLDYLLGLLLQLALEFRDGLFGVLLEQT